ncbi:precorrin-6A/cobalt-precorrin-6A reductase, partial [Ralstonia pseudosolanacearum]|uniref:precorrin-6A/cobalt-precorrin-6A reductase n=1 Tax=Ralstonia pseudosolanacearum TaxID=1310165 RepID=UPI003CE8A8A6
SVAATPRRARCIFMSGPMASGWPRMWRDWGIDCVVTKDSGEAGGYHAKAAAAAALGIPLIVVDRPAIDYPAVAHDFAGVLMQLADLANRNNVEA